MRHALLIAAFALTVAACSAQPPAEGATLAEAGCHDSAIDHVFDLEYVGALDESGNAQLHVGSTDGTCAGAEQNVVTVLQADVKSDARDACKADGATSAVPLYYAGYDIAAGNYLCLVVTTPGE